MDVKHDIHMCQSYSTRLHNAKKIFPSSFQAKFLKIMFTKVDGTTLFLMPENTPWKIEE